MLKLKTQSLDTGNNHMGSSKDKSTIFNTNQDNASYTFSAADLVMKILEIVYLSALVLLTYLEQEH
jgi:hypothetical protein